MKFNLDWQRRFATLASIAINCYIAIADWIIRPIHMHGVFQPVLGFLNGVSMVLQFPGYIVIHRTDIRGRLSHPHETSTSAWMVMLVINLILWAVAIRLSMGLFFPVRRKQDEGKKGDAEKHTSGGAPDAELGIGSTLPDDLPAGSTSSSAGVSRRSFLTTSSRLGLAAVTGAGLYGMIWEARDFRISHRRFPLADLPPELAGLRIVQLTDIHHGPALSLEYVRRVVQATNALDADLIFLTGDYVHRSWQYIEPVVNELAKLRAKIGIVGVMGNHDWWEDAALTRECFARTGIPLIDNDRLFVTPDRKLVRKSGEGICVAGVGDYTEDVCRPNDALGGVPANMPRLLLSHNPDFAEEPDLIRSKYRVDLMLSGHTHGGQVWVPGLGTPITPSRYGQKYASGLVQGPVCPVYVSCGIGTTVLPLRFCIPPEIAVIEFDAA